MRYGRADRFVLLSANVRSHACEHPIVGSEHYRQVAGKDCVLDMTINFAPKRLTMHLLSVVSVARVHCPLPFRVCRHGGLEGRYRASGHEAA